MTKPVEILLQPAYILHSWPYRNTSLLLDVFTKDYGRIGVIAQGVSTPAKSGTKAVLQAFQPLLLSCSGRGELMALRQVEARGIPPVFEGKALFCGLYLNELLQRLLTRFDPYPQLFVVYEQSIVMLRQEKLEIVLRQFERQLLLELGYELTFNIEAHSSKPILKNDYYFYHQEEGYFCRLSGEAIDQAAIDPSTIFYGKNLLAIAANQWTEQAVLTDAKRLMRIVLARLLDNKPLKTRQFFAKLNDFGD